MATQPSVREASLSEGSLAAIASLAAAILWIVLAWRTPTSTYHFAPIVVVLAGPFVVRQRTSHRPLVQAAKIVGISVMVAVAALVLLALATKMEGPTFWSDDGAPLEAALFTAASALAAVALLTR